MLGIVQSVASEKGLLKLASHGRLVAGFLERQGDLSLRQGNSTAHIRIYSDPHIHM